MRARENCPIGSGGNMSFSFNNDRPTEFSFKLLSEVTTFSTVEKGENRKTRK